jgi:hypothetical protein
LNKIILLEEDMENTENSNQLSETTEKKSFKRVPTWTLIPLFVNNRSKDIKKKGNPN